MLLSLLLIVSLFLLGSGFRSYRFAFFTFLFLSITYTRLLAYGVGKDSFVLTFQRVGSVVMLFMMIVYIFKEGKNNIYLKWWYEYRKSIIFNISLYWVWKVISTAVVSSIFELSNVFGLLDEFLFSIVFIFLGFMAIRSKDDIIIIVNIIVAGTLIHQFTGSIEYIINGHIFPESIISYNVSERFSFENHRYGSFRVPGLFDNSLKLTYYLCLVFPFLLISYKINKSRFWKFLSTLSIILLFPIMFFTGSRSGLLILIFEIIIFIIVFSLNYIRVSKRGVLSFFSITLISAFLLTFLFGESLVEFATFQLSGKDVAYEEDLSAESRAYQYVVVANSLNESLIFGYGRRRSLIADLDDLVTLDNYYLRVLLESGIVGLIFLIFLLITVLGFFYKSYLRKVHFVEKYITFNLLITVLVFILMLFVSSVPDLHFIFYLVIVISALYREDSLIRG